MTEQARRTRENSLGWMIQRLARRLDDAMNGELAAHGLTIQHFAVMMTVLEHGSPTQAEIGRRFAMPAYAISRALDTLEKGGFIVRRAHPSSRRAHQIEATEQGRALGPHLFAIVAKVNASLTETLTEDETAALGRLLVKAMGSTAL